MNFLLILYQGIYNNNNTYIYIYIYIYYNYILTNKRLGIQ